MYNLQLNYNLSQSSNKIFINRLLFFQEIFLYYIEEERLMKFVHGRICYNKKVANAS